jgi:NAD(P)-dependent dehydrogenase (short-subunit alcohol dehydrogenase family)
VDILVNNAGAIPGGTLQEIEEPRWREAWDLKVFGYINLTRAVYADMAKRKRGVIVNIIGAAGERMDAGYIAGSTGNASLMAFSRALGGASPKDGIRVVAINPGMTATDRMVTLQRKRAQDRFGDPERWKELLEGAPFGRAGTPDEIAALATFLASDLSGYTTGSVFTVDGGASVRSTY